MIATHAYFSIEAFRGGSRHAFNYIFDNYYLPIYFFANKLVPDKLIAEDIAQESFVRLWEKHSSFTEQSAIKAFLYIITRNACFNFMKQSQRDKKYEAGWAMCVDDEEDHVLNRLTGSEVLREIHTAVANLPPVCRMIIRMSYIEGLKNNEIAERLNLSIQTIKNQKARGLYLLKKRHWKYWAIVIATGILL